MSLVDVFFAAAILGAWLIGPVALFAAIGAAIRAGRWVKRIARAARQWKRDVQTDPDGSSIDDDELADWLAIGTEQLNDEIKQQREEEGT